MRQGAEGLQRQDPVAGDPQGLSGDALEALWVLSFPVLEIASWRLLLMLPLKLSIS